MAVAEQVTIARITDYLPATFTIPGLTEEQFLKICQQFPDDFLEYTADGTVIIMPPTDPESSGRVAEVVAQLRNWTLVEGHGRMMGPDGGFRLPGGSRRSPDAAWFNSDRWAVAKEESDLRFPPFSPEFVIEVRSPSDRLRNLREKMQEYMDNGVQLGWLIDPENRTVEIYRPQRAPETLNHPANVAGEGPVAGFVLSLDRIF